jgi:hypothetical protein
MRPPIRLCHFFLYEFRTVILCKDVLTDLQNFEAGMRPNSRLHTLKNSYAIEIVYFYMN